MLINLNPELARLLQIECTRPRILFVIALALALQYLAYTLASADFRHAATAAQSFRIFWFGMATAVWGSYRLIQSVLDEHQQRTWYWQMMLPLSPWQITLGKFLGALALPWLGGCIMLVSLPLTGNLFAVLAISIFANAIALLLAFVLTMPDRKSTSAFLILLLPFAVSVFGHITLSHLDDTEATFDFYTAPDTLQWYGTHWNAYGVFIASLLLYAGWALVGAWQFAKRHKQMTTTPLLWLAFLACYIVHSYGFRNADLLADDLRQQHFLLFAQFVFFSMVYLAAAFVCNRADELLPFLHALGTPRSWRARWESIPAWLVALLLYLAVLPVALWVVAATSHRWFLLAYSFYLLRDLAILLWFTLQVNARMPIGITLVYFAILYLLVPEILDAADVPLHWYLPDLANAFWGSALVAGTQAVIILTLLYHHRVKIHYFYKK